jgi:hypothetical protein
VYLTTEAEDRLNPEKGKALLLSRRIWRSTDGHDNTAIGEAALFHNANEFHTAIGVEALESNASDKDNTAIGFEGLLSNTGSDNIALGGSSGDNLTTGNNNIDIDNQGGDAGESNTIRMGEQRTQTATFIAGIFGDVTAGIPVYVNPNGCLSTTPPRDVLRRRLNRWIRPAKRSRDSSR